jgi:hypothetical protein
MKSFRNSTASAFLTILSTHPFIDNLPSLSIRNKTGHSLPLVSRNLHFALRKSFLPLFLFLYMLSSCTPKADPEWSIFLPEQTVLVYVGDDDPDGSLRSEIGELVGESLLTDQIFAEREQVPPVATILIPESVDQLSTMWIFPSSADVASRLKQAGWRSKGSYSISEGRVDLYENSGNALASSTMGDWTIVSTRSRTIEQSLRSAVRTNPHLAIANTPGFHVNVSELGRLIAPLTSAAFRAELAQSFHGLGVVVVRPADDASNPKWTFQLTTTASTSRLVRYLTAGTSDRSASFSVPSGMSLGMVWNDPYGSRMYDSLRTIGQSGEIARSAAASFASHFSPEVAMYISDGPSAGVAYVRKASMANVGIVFADLYQRGVLDGDGEVYVGRDPALAKAICSGLCDLRQYTIGLRDDGVIISASETLVRRLMVGDGVGSSLESRVPAGGVGADGVIGSYGWADISSLISAARSIGWLMSDRPVPAILRRFNTVGYSMQPIGGRMVLNLELQKDASASTRTDLILAWQYPLRGDQLVAEPVVAVLNGKVLVLATTESGRVLALSSDGNLQFEVTTGTQVPVGGVEVYDWYANKSPVVIQAAGSVIYAWSPSGSLLPGFPFVLDSPIAAPIAITDVDANAEPEIIVATMDERLHLINRNGRGVAGWPIFTDGTVQMRPKTAITNGNWSIEVSTNKSTEWFDRFGQRKMSRLHVDDITEKPDTLTTQLATPFDGSAPILYGQYPVLIDIDGDGVQELIVVLDGQLRCYRLPSNRTN